MKNARPKPDPATMRRVEELLRGQLQELGEDLASIPPHEISRHMFCGVHESGSLSYIWKGVPILDVEPERQADGGIRWRFFTRDATARDS